MFLVNYQQHKDTLLQLLQQCTKTLAQNNLNPRFLKECRDVQNKLADNTFNLVVMGQFKRGKSTLINALLGREILPTAVVPLTSVVTVIRFGDVKKVNVIFLNESVQEIPISQLDKFITERLNPHNEKQVDRVEIFYPCELLRDGAQFVDTPGVGSVFEHNTLTAYDYIPRADAVLFLITADPPISREEMNFLTDVREHAGKIFFLKNKIDHLSHDELAESLSFTRKVLADKLRLKEENVLLFPISAKWALQGKLLSHQQLLQRSRLPDVERELEAFLLQEKGQLLLHNSKKRAERLLEEAASHLHLEMKAITTPQVKLTKKIAAFRQSQTTIQHAKEDIEHLVKGGLQHIMDEYDERARLFKQQKLPELEKWLQQQFFARQTLGVRALAKALEENLRQTLLEIFVPWRKQQESYMDRTFSNLGERLSRRANDIIDEIYQIAGELFDLHIQKYKSSEKLAKEKYFYFKVGEESSALDPLENAITYGVAALVTPKILLKKVLKLLPQQFDKQCGRIRSDLYDRLRESGTLFLQRLRQQIDDAYVEIDTIIARAQGQHRENAESVEARRDELQHFMKQLSALKNQLMRLDHGT